ncbi:MAG TPA: catalase [Syntrophomonadaceae bacterium]|nr:catalase [Syntrophomonadaceae bacterium]
MLKAGERGPALIQDFQFIKKIMHFTKERIPERVVHARGTGAHGELELYESMEKYTSADFLQRPGEKTPVFARISTLQGSKGSADTVRDIRGFALKFYTQEGVFDLTALSFAVFFIHDPMKFPDLVHATKPEPKDEIPQAQTAHDNYWDFVSQNQETAHGVMWLMSDRGIPKSYRTMGAFGVNTYKWINKAGEVFFVKYHFKPILGVHSFVWDECQKVAGKDPDFHRKDLMNAIEMGNYPEWEFGVQILPEKDEFMFDFDILDDTKLWPEELVPVTPVGKLTLNKNVDNFFAETEQAAFNPANLVPGIDISNDPIIQGRMLAYEDTHMHRLGGPNFNQIPINRSISPVNNYQRAGSNQMNVFTENVDFKKNSDPHGLYTTPKEDGGYHFHMETVKGEKIKGRPDKFTDFFTQPKLFYNSLEPIEKKHLIQAFQFEVSKVKKESIRQNVVNMFANVDQKMADEIADYLGLKAIKSEPIQNQGQGGKDKFAYEGKSVMKSETLSQEKTPKMAKGLKLAILVTEDTDINEINSIAKEMEKEEIVIDWVGEKLGKLNEDIEIKATLYTTYPVLYDGILVTSMQGIEKANLHLLEAFVEETYNHYKPIFFHQDGKKNLKDKYLGEPGVVEIKSGIEGAKEIAQIRFWDRNIAK